MPRRSDARPRAIRATAELLQRQGYAATGLEEVLATSGAPKGSFYFHFPHGKEQLAIEAVLESGRVVRDVIDAVVMSAATAGDAIRRFADLEASELEQSAFELGCPVATIALEMASRSEGIRTATDEVFASWITVIASRLERDGLPAAEARSVAQWVIATLEGSLVLARAARDAAVIRLLAERTASVVDAVTHG